MVKRCFFVFPLIVSASSLLFFIFYFRPYYFARYSLFASVVMAACGVGTIVFYVRGSPSHLPNTILQWIGSYLALLLIVASIFITIYTSPYVGRSEIYDNPYIVYSSDNDLKFDSAEIESCIHSLMNGKLPTLTFRLLGNAQQRRLDDYEGNVIVLNFWATWCTPCVRELSALDSLQMVYRNRGLSVITISGEPRDTLIAYVNTYHLTTIVGHFTKEDVPVMPFRATPVLPQTFILDRKGNLREWFTGKRSFAWFEQSVNKYF